LTLKESLAVCDQFPPLVVREVDFTGGEPLMNPNWSTIAAYLGDLGIRVQVITNGLLLSSRTLKRMEEVGVGAIGISLDGLEPTHDFIRGHKGLFRRVVDGARRAVDAGFTVAVITTVTRANLGVLPQLMELLCRLGVDHWQLQPIFPLGRARGATELELTPQMYLDLGDFVLSQTDIAASRGLYMRPSDPYGYFTEFDTRPVPWKGCPAGRLACGITSNGKVKGCLSLPDHLVEGDLRERDLWDIWYDPGAFAYTRRFSADAMGPYCHGCELAEQCMGGCTAMSFGQTGSFHNNPLCFHGMLSRGATGEAGCGSALRMNVT
jgi:radical SAM protein with 4Fe4S-binding SPASM domain